MTRPARPAQINAVFGAVNEVGKVFDFEDSKVLFPLIVVLTRETLGVVCYGRM